MKNGKRFLYSSWQVGALGGNANNGANAGVTYWNLNNSSGNDNANISGQLSLLYFKGYKNHASWQNINNALQVLVGKPKILRQISRL